MRNVIIDSDPGIDDTLALLIAISAHLKKQINLIGITIVHGNHYDIDLLASNACYLLEKCGLNEIPVVKGCGNPMKEKYYGHSGLLFHGENGFGDVETFSPKKKAEENITAVEFLLSKSRMFKNGELDIITLGPVTNIGMAVKSDPEFSRRVGRLVIMGGACKSPGNVTPRAEANIYNDPVAYDTILKADWKEKIVMVGLDLTQYLRISEKEYNKWLENKNWATQFVNDILVFYLNAQKRINRNPAFDTIPLHDPSAVMAYIYPQFFTGDEAYIQVETEGKLTKGVCVADWNKGYWPDEKQQCIILDKCVDEEKFKDTMKNHFAQLP